MHYKRDMPQEIYVLSFKGVDLLGWRRSKGLMMRSLLLYSTHPVVARKRGVRRCTQMEYLSSGVSREFISDIILS